MHVLLQLCGLYGWHRWLSIVDYQQIITSHEQTGKHFFFQSCIEILIRDLLFNEEIVSLDHYLFSSWMLTLMPDSIKGQRFKIRLDSFCWMKALKLSWHIDKSRLILCGWWLNMTHPPFLYLNVAALTKEDIFLPCFLKNSISAGEGEKSFNFLPLHARTIHTVMLQSGTRISVTLKNTVPLLSGWGGKCTTGNMMHWRCFSSWCGIEKECRKCYMALKR